jgi:hypothetical protein
MKEFAWALSLGFCGALLSLLAHGWDASAVDKTDRRQYSSLLSSNAVKRITQRSERLSMQCAEMVKSRVPVLTAENIALWIRPTLRRGYLLIGLAPVVLLLVVAAALGGLVLREASLDHMAWRSPTLAYVAKKFAFIFGGGGIVFFILSPTVLPLWLIYVFISSLCGGLVLYVGSLGRI